MVHRSDNPRHRPLAARGVREVQAKLLSGYYLTPEAALLTAEQILKRHRRLFLLRGAATPAPIPHPKRVHDNRQ